MKRAKEICLHIVPLTLDAVSMFATSYVIAEMYGWFVRTPFDLPPLNVYQVLGMYFFVSFLYSWKMRIENLIGALSGDDDEGSEQPYFTSFFKEMITLAIWYIAGYLVSIAIAW